MVQSSCSGAAHLFFSIALGLLSQRWLSRLQHGAIVVQRRRACFRYSRRVPSEGCSCHLTSPVHSDDDDHESIDITVTDDESESDPEPTTTDEEFIATSDSEAEADDDDEQETERRQTLPGP